MLDVKIKDINMQFKTSSEVFSPKNVDKGTLAMLSVVEWDGKDKVLDVGCGYGIVGIFFAKVIGSINVVMTDIEDKAVELSRENMILNNVQGIRLHQGDGLKNIHEKDFTLILSNPPYHADFSVPKEFIEKGFNLLAVGGKMYMVTKRKEWYKNKLIAIFGGVRIWEIDGYYVFMAMKKNTSYANIKQKNKKK